MRCSENYFEIYCLKNYPHMFASKINCFFLPWAPQPRVCVFAIFGISNKDFSIPTILGCPAQTLEKFLRLSGLSSPLWIEIHLNISNKTKSIPNLLGCPAQNSEKLLGLSGLSSTVWIESQLNNLCFLSNKNKISWFVLSSKLFGLSSPVVFDSEFKSYGLSSPDVLWVLHPKYQGAIQPKSPALFSSHSFLWGCAVCAN